ncbi:YbaB/EbfC family nucleoid-associated protein [Actinosynnema sp. NPDC002837]|jgi:DNA-binding protein YbaB
MDALLPSSANSGYVRLAEEFRRIREVRARSRATAWSDDGLVEATVDAGGRLIGLRLDPRVHRDPDSAALARTVLQTVQAANREATRAAFEVVSRFLPADADPDTADLRFDLALAELDRRIRQGEQR